MVERRQVEVGVVRFDFVFQTLTVLTCLKDCSDFCEFFLEKGAKRVRECGVWPCQNSLGEGKIFVYAIAD